jgi:glycerol-3-phosphate dehydrogenase (NAD(P)+)
LTIHQTSKIAVLGGGSWATAIVKILSENDVNVRWWLRSESDRDHIINYGHNPSYLSGVRIDRNKIHATAQLADAFADTVILAIPAAFIPQALHALPMSVFEGKTIVSTIKGMVPDMNCLVTQYMADKFAIPEERFLIVAGPCHAEEVALEKLSYLTIGGMEAPRSQEFAHLLTCRYVKVSVIDDVYGAEYCAVMKNIIAIACGIAHGLNFGDNFQAVLVANALQEIKRFLKLIYPMKRNLNASAYLGDLLVTTYSQFSRNRTFGNMIGRGYSVKSAQMEMKMVAEGYYAVKSIHEIISRQEEPVRMPITKAVYNILYEKISPLVEFKILTDSLR